MKITEHTLDTATPDRINGGGPMETRRCLVIHFTGGASGTSSIEHMRRVGTSAHLVIERDGKIWQCRPFNRTAGHAGVSRWKDPKTGRLYVGLNSCSIGIELANAGDDAGALKWAKRQPGFQSMIAKHRNGGTAKEWEGYPPAQMAVLKEVAALLVAEYNLDDITGHDCIAPERKEDPGPAFNMQGFRASLGFSGLPKVHRL